MPDNATSKRVHIIQTIVVNGLHVHQCKRCCRVWLPVQTGQRGECPDA